MATQNKTERISFASSNKVIDYPDFLDIQVKSFKDFFQIGTSSEERSDEGLYKVFDENFPISDSREIFNLEFLDLEAYPLICK